ncbi:MAG: cupredoxin domain-containing protein [Armatimonadota bacterium]|nr:cupredoxin domain-containing protein [Armatimonadota bacterium]MDR7533981.1 cupredoxin domain-containing protein [Armatimonadota bacterium]MDR7536449.1 cupredoxin domain-containing protein [Armatimonadota bacterium]
MRTALAWAAVVVIAAVAAGCGGRAPQQPAQPAPTAGTPVAGGTITIVMKDNLYEPATVEIKAGAEYEFVVPNQGATVHNLVIQGAPGGDITSDVAVNAGQESRFKVKIDRPGTYKMQCTYHTEMVGDLKVVP